MPEALSQADTDALHKIVANMQDAWNVGDGARFAQDLAEDADFVNIRAEHHQGRDVIAAGHQGIFDTIYKGSTNRYEVKSARALSPDTALVHVDSTLECPTGPLTGTSRALFSMVARRKGGAWEIVSFHNTLAPRTLRQ
jgi:uncharacterized protein (TIGR02246 family)